jgi:hypothetical protein
MPEFFRLRLRCFDDGCDLADRLARYASEVADFVCRLAFL